jgi:outer membrane protein assembly factor BamB
VHAFDAATGAVRWTRELAGYTQATLAYDDGGRLYVAGGNSGLMTGIDAGTGAVLWSVPASQSQLTPVAAGGRVYLAVNGLVAYDEATGQTLWTRPGPFAFPAVLGGTLYSVELSTPPVLHAIAPPTGADRWTFAAQPGGPALISPVFTAFPAVANGVVYANLGRVLAIDGLSKRLLWTGPEGAVAAPVVADGHLLIRGPEGPGVYGT